MPKLFPKEVLTDCESWEEIEKASSTLFDADDWEEIPSKNDSSYQKGSDDDKLGWFQDDIQTREEEWDICHEYMVLLSIYPTVAEIDREQAGQITSNLKWHMPRFEEVGYTCFSEKDVALRSVFWALMETLFGLRKRAGAEDVPVLMIQPREGKEAYEYDEEYEYGSEEEYGGWEEDGRSEEKVDRSDEEYEGWEEDGSEEEYGGEDKIDGSEEEYGSEKEYNRSEDMYGDGPEPAKAGDTCYYIFVVENGSVWFTEGEKFDVAIQVSEDFWDAQKVLLGCGRIQWRGPIYLE
ncbi:hypothetical protein BJ508DRAFT_332110 [Ascobolus immersus RN42]|uniref:Uncharacterized protein n=1 Tax=Ascobolus immersus RN42 TaxID=1160509 RepID=A0A3N4I0S8_ASCIM|nr:hypothetical protein BJ508DRAFT_332110 [Ascobolus immersus RN42]